MKIVVAVGLPGSGKSTYLVRLGANAISSDEVRRLIIDDPHDQTIHNRVFCAMRYLVRQRIAVGRPVTYVDATHLTPWERQPYFIIAQRYGCEVEALFFDVPVEICLDRNRRRQPMVPDEAIREMARRMIPPSIEEGFMRIDQIGAECHLLSSKSRRTTMALSARNQLPGVVDDIQIGDIMAHVVVKVGNNTIESIITRNSAEELKLKKGDSVRVVVKSTEVMIQKD